MAGLVAAISLRNAPCRLSRITGTSPVMTRLQQPQLAQFAPHLLGHLRGAGGCARQIARRLLGFEIAPALERRTRPRLDQLAFAVEHDLTAPDAVLAGGLADIENAFAAGDLALDDPEQRTTVLQLLGPFGQHARRVDVFGLLAAFLLFLQLLLDPVLEIGDRVTTDAKLDEMKRHYN